MTYQAAKHTCFVKPGGGEIEVPNKVFQHRFGDPVTLDNTDGILSGYTVIDRRVNPHSRTVRIYLTYL
jgi:hypothetical protein